MKNYRNMLSVIFRQKLSKLGKNMKSCKKFILESGRKFLKIFGKSRCLFDRLGVIIIWCLIFIWPGNLWNSVENRVFWTKNEEEFEIFKNLYINLTFSNFNKYFYDSVSTLRFIALRGILLSLKNFPISEGWNVQPFPPSDDSELKHS